MKKQQGLTLIELMLSIALALLIISGVVSMVSRAIMNERLISAENELQENLNFVNNRLGFTFKEALSSPCGDVSSMLTRTDGNSSNSYIKRAVMVGSNNSQAVQNIPNVIIPSANPPTGSAARTIHPGTIRADQLPMFSIGSQGAATSSGVSLEPILSNGQPVSTALANIVPGSEYIVVIESSEKLILDLNREIVASGLPPTAGDKGVRGGSGIAGALQDMNINAIPTSRIQNRVGLPPIPYIITDCIQADIFLPSAPVTNNSIPIAPNLAFSSLLGGFKQSETVIAPVELIAYYLSQPGGPETRSFARANLTLGGAGQPLVGGIQSLTFEWGLGEPNQQRVQAYFTTQEIMDSGINVGQFRDKLISVRATITATGYNNKFHLRTTGAPNDDLRKIITPVYTLRNKMSRL